MTALPMSPNGWSPGQRAHLVAQQDAYTGFPDIVLDPREAPGLTLDGLNDQLVKLQLDHGSLQLQLEARQSLHDWLWALTYTLVGALVATAILLAMLGPFGPHAAPASSTVHFVVMEPPPTPGPHDSEGAS